MDTIQPVYCFLIDSPDGEAPFFDDGDPEGYKSVTYAYVPALLPEQLSEKYVCPSFQLTIAAKKRKT